jgi:adenylate cyclase
MRGDCPLPKLGDQVVKRGMAGVALANVAGAVFIFTYLSFIAPGERVDNASASALTDVALLVAYLAVSVPLTGVAIDRLMKRAASWVPEDRSPTAEERQRTLALPRRIAELSFVPWIGAAVFFGLVSSLYAGHSSRFVLEVVFGTLDAGLVSCTVAFLLIERAMRPLFAFALAGAEPARARVAGVRLRLLITWVLGSGVPLAAMAWLPAAADGATERADIGPAVTVLCGVGLLAGFLITWATAHSVAEPLGEIEQALRKVKAGDLNVRVEVDRAGDLGALQMGVNEMVHGLRERARLEDLFGRHVGPEVAQRALELGTGLDSEQREASALFVDMIGSTAMAEVLPPGEVLATLNAYFGCVVDVVDDEGGWVNKFEGDGALCIFGAPATQPDHAARALRAACKLRQRLLELRSTHPGLDAAIGVSSGMLVAGNVGTEKRYEYTVIGRPVNEAARLTDLAKAREIRVLASKAAVERAGEARRWRSVGTVVLRGQTAPAELFEPIDVREPAKQPPVSR